MSTDAVRAALAELVCLHDSGNFTPWSEAAIFALTVARAALSEPAPGVGVPDGYRLVDGTRLLQQICAACAATLKAGPGVAVPLPPEVSAEFRKFMRGEPNIIEQLPFADVVKMAESPEVSALAAAPSPAMPVDPDKQLCTFYGVDTFPALVEAMEHHIKNLQAKLPQNDMPAATKTRFA